MGIEFKVNLKKKFTVNGQSYESLEEMPPELRQTFEKVLLEAAAKKVAVSSSRITVNGQVQASVDEMSPEERRLYEETLKLIQEKPGQLPPETLLPPGQPRHPAGPKVVEVGAPASLRLAIFGLILLGMVLAAWWLLKAYA